MKIFNTILFIIIIASVQLFSQFDELSKIKQGTRMISKSTELSGGLDLSGIDTIKILAVMVEFQQDEDQTTVGDGKFSSIYKKTYDNTILDPLPHNKEYFEAHLEFAKNYYKKSSNGNIIISSSVLPNVITVTKTMRNYSPPIKSTDFSSMAEFTKEVWELAVNNNPGFEFSKYNLFAIFHAGVGRDISLPGSLGNEKDLPSVFMGFDLLKKSLGDTFNGIQADGNYRITNSMILPQTNNREVESLGSTYLFEVTINGLIVANIASYLGLPDLFDTKTGLSAIGRFGLMDGQSIFAFNGVFTPEPSPWERIYLSKKLNFSLPVKQISYSSDYSVYAKSFNDTTILRVNLNSSEYYLLENRRRDKDFNGCNLTIWNQGQIYTKHFDKDTTGFYSYAIDSLEGVIIDVDDFDWASPGDGIVIWHIDENIIDEKYANNSINVDKKRRGVRVIEADGINDIGVEFQTIFGDIVIGEGSQEDFFFASNDAELYLKNKNKFNISTRPATLTNNGSNSLLSFSEFSDTSNLMTFKLAIGDSILKPLNKVSLKANNKIESLKIVSKNNGNEYYYIDGATLYKFLTNGVIVDSIVNFSKTKPASFINNLSEYIVGTFDNKLNIIKYEGNNKTFNTVELAEDITSSPVIVTTSTEQKKILFGSSRGKLYQYSLTEVPALLSVDSTFVNVGSIRYVLSDDLYVGYIIDIPVDGNSSPYISKYVDAFGNISLSSYCEFAALTKNKEGKYVVIANDKENNFFIISEGKTINQFKINSKETVKQFILSDIKNDGENYIIFGVDNILDAFNYSGARADNFPIYDPNKAGFSSSLVSADFYGDKKGDIIAVTNDGRLFGYEGGSNKLIPSFPLELGKKQIVPLNMFSNDKKISLAVVDASNTFYSWEISPTEGLYYWKGDFANEQNSLFVSNASSSSAITGVFMPKDKVYNYPNPVYEGKTYIRYYVSEDSKINIKIFDLAGDFVTELSNYARGGMDNETMWDVSSIQNGVYLARIEATSNSGKSESAIIKIAVVK